MLRLKNLGKIQLKKSGDHISLIFSLIKFVKLQTNQLFYIHKFLHSFLKENKFIKLKIEELPIKALFINFHLHKT